MEFWMSDAVVFLQFLAIVAAPSRAQGESHSNETDFPDSKVFCHSSACKETAKYLLDAIDDTVDPCDDFYGHACGKWMETHKFNDNELQANEFYYLQRKTWKDLSRLLEEPITGSFPSEIKLRKLYRQCKDEEQRETLRAVPLLNLLDEAMGGWPLVTPYWNVSKFNVVDAMLHSFMAGNEPFFKVEVETNDTHPELDRIIRIRYPVTWAEDAVLFDVQMGPLYMDGYLELLRSVTTLLLKDTNQTVDSTTLSTNLGELVDFERHIVMSKYCDLDGDVRTTLSDLERHQLFNSTVMGQLTKIIRAYFTAAKMTDALHGNVSISMNDLCFWNLLDNKIVEIEQQGADGIKRIASIIGWRMIKSALNFLSRNYTDVLGEYERTLSGASTAASYSIGERCAVAASQSLPLVTANVYIKSLSDQSALINKVDDMLQNIKAGLRGVLDTLDWMDAASRQAAYEKLNATITITGYRDLVLTNTSAIDLEYDEVWTKDDYFRTITAAIKDRGFRNLREMTKPFVRSNPRPDIEGDVTIVDFKSDLKANKILIPVAGLQSPMFHPGGPQYYNYGGLGTFTGRALVLHFNLEGSLFDDKGIKQPWWTQDTKNAYLERMPYMAWQYGNYTTLSGQVDGHRTMRGNIADNGGMRAAYKAYMHHLEQLGHAEQAAPKLQHFSSQQLFFLSAARILCTNMRPNTARVHLLPDHRAPSKWRVNGALSNMVEFSHAFNCSEGGKMSQRLGKDILF